MEQLGEQMNEIGSVVAEIHAAADRTQTMALQAAMDAARSGQEGQGFAAVAEALRIQAERTVKSAHEIKLMIQAIQNSTLHTLQPVPVDGDTDLAFGTKPPHDGSQALASMSSRLMQLSERLLSLLMPRQA